MKKILYGTVLFLVVWMITACVSTQPGTAAAPQQEKIILTVPQGTEISVRIKTADGSGVTVHGGDTILIAGSDEARELHEDKPMQKVKAQGTQLVFSGDIREFDVKDNGTITALDSSACPQLEVLYCAGNKIASLDLSRNIHLKRLQCYNNALTDLNLTSQKKAELIWCGINKLTALDVSTCTSLVQLRCYLNQIDAAAMDTLLLSLPAAESKTAVREARILATGEKIQNALPSAAALETAASKGWTVLDSGNNPVSSR